MFSWLSRALFAPTDRPICIELLEERRLLAVFEATTRLPFAESPDRIALADFNRDGRSDIAAVTNVGAMEVMLSGPVAGQYARAFTIAPPAFLSDVDAIDWNGDGYTDLVATAEQSRQYFVYVSNGSGGFAAPFAVAVSGLTGSANFRTSVFADFNGDSQIDVATADGWLNRVDIALRTGVNTFGAGVSVTVGNAPLDIAWGDVDGDGDRDLVTANASDESMSVIRNDGAGVFGNTLTKAVSPSPQSVAVGDLNGDGRADVVAVSSGTSGVISVFESVVGGPGVLDLTVRQTHAFRDGRGVSIGDIDSDGDADIVASADAATIIVRNTGDIAIGTREQYAFGTRRIALGNADNEAGEDLFASDFASDVAIVAFNNANGVFSGELVSAPYLSTLTPSQLIEADINNDNRADILAFSPTSDDSTVMVFRNIGGGLAAPESYSFSSGGVRASYVATGDVNGDGFDDVVGLTLSNADYLIRLGSASGLLGPQITAMNMADNPVNGPTTFVLADMNGDGRADLVTDISFGGQYSFGVAMATAGGLFVTPAFYGAGDVSALAVRDIDGDGLNDVIAYNNGAQFEIYLGAANGTLATTPVNITSPIGQGTVAFANLTGNALTDMVISGSEVLIFRNTSTVGAPSFTTAYTFDPQFEFPSSLVTADIDGDGDQDIINQQSTTAAVLRNDGTTFALAQTYELPSGTSLLLQVDNGLAPDLVTLNTTADTVEVAFNAGNGRFLGRTPVIPRAPAPGHIYIKDLTGDGILDLVTLSAPGAESLAISRGTTAGFQPAVLRSNGVSGFGDAALEDFTGDGIPDLLIVERSNAVRRLVLHVGTGNSLTYFAAPQVVFEATQGPTSRFEFFAVGNVDGVAGLDVVLTQEDDDLLWTLRNLGNGQFVFGSTVATGDRPGELTLADFDGDGDLDAAVVNRGGLSPYPVTIHRNNGAGVFATASAGETFTVVPRFISQITAGDLNADGKPEMIVSVGSNLTPLSLFIFQNTSSVGDPVNFTARPRLVIGPAATPHVLKLRDINSDGRPDLVVGSDNTFTGGTAGVLTVLENNGTLDFPTVAAVPFRAFDVETIRLNGDTTLDFIGVDGVNFGAALLQSRVTYSVALASTVVADNSTLLTATIRFSSAQLVNLNSIGSGDLKLYSTNGYFAFGTLVGTPQVQPDASVLATFSFPAPIEDSFQPQGYWDASDNGAYYLEVVANAFTSPNGQSRPAQLLQTYNLFFNAPTANLISTAVTDGGTFFDVTVRYTDHVGSIRGISLTTITKNDVQLTGPGGYLALGSLQSESSNPAMGQSTAVYRFAARSSAGGSNWWDNTDNGAYTLSVRTGEVAENSGFEVAPVVLRNYGLFFTTPAAEIVSAAIVYSAGGDGLQVTVRFTDTTPGMSYGSVSTGDFELYATGILNYSFTGNLLSKSGIVNGVMTAVYGFAAREGGANANIARFWDATDNGSYFLRARTNQVFDANGVPVPPVNIIPAARADSFGLFFTNPGADLLVFNPQAGQTSTDFTIRIATAGPLDISTIATGDFRLLGPAGFNQSLAYVTSSLVLESTAGGTYRYSLRYRVTPPGGTWNNADNGTYALVSNTGAFADQAGRTNVARTLWTNFLFFT